MAKTPRRRKISIDEVSTEAALDIIDPSQCPFRDKDFNKLTREELERYPNMSSGRALDMCSTERVDDDDGN